MKRLLFVDFVMTELVRLFSGNFDVKKEAKKEVWEKVSPMYHFRAVNNNNVLGAVSEQLM
jgi:hypothetical protein